MHLIFAVSLLVTLGNSDAFLPRRASTNSPAQVYHSAYDALCEATKRHGVRNRGDDVIAPFIYVQRDYYGVEHLIAYGEARYYFWLPGKSLHFLSRDCYISAW